MPDGSQSWKIIKTSANSSGRIAQACDRCRSKKIKCDGKLPQCTQCINVGFECKTSDKLSRRAFPRGYTETLEQRVRTLEKELREANATLEAKTKQLNDTNAKCNDKTSQARTSLKARLPSESDEIVIDDVFRLLSRNEIMNGSFLGSSSGRPFFELFKRRLQISKNVCVDFDEVLPFYRQSFSDGGPDDDSELTDTNTSFTLPSKSSAEKLVNSFFTSWHLLFPVLHRPSFQWDFEAMYTEKASKDPANFAQMWLVLAIAARDAAASGREVPEDHAELFLRARFFLRKIQMKQSVHGLKALILAQLYTLSEENWDLLWHYKTLSVGWAYKLGLHRSQKQMKLGPLTTEMRKRVFWSLYVVDAFSSAIVGLPRLLDDNQIDTEFPADLDDDFVTEMGFLPTPPGNFSMMSAAIANFRLSKILSRLLSELYTPQKVSLATIRSVETELNDWRSGLPTYLRVDLPNCIPSSTNFHSHASMLLLSYHWVRTLIHRPILASTLLKKDETIKATVSLAESSRAIISIFSALHDKNMTTTAFFSVDFTLWSSCISILEIALVYDKLGQIDDTSAKSIETAMSILQQQLQISSNSKLHEKRLRFLERSFNAIPSRNAHPIPKIDTRNIFSNTNVSPPTSCPSTWTPTLGASVNSAPTFDFNFMRTGRLSSASITESVASSFDPSTAWTPTGMTDRFSTSPELENSKNDILEAFLSTIVDDSYPPPNSAKPPSLFSLGGGDADDSPLGMIMPNTFEWSGTSSFSDEESDSKPVLGTSPSGVSPGNYIPMFLSPPFSSDEHPSNGGQKSFDGYKDVYGYNENDGHIHTAPNLFSDETSWAV